MRAGAVDAAVVGLVGVSKEMRAVRALQGRADALARWSAEARQLGDARARERSSGGSALTSESEGRRPRPRQDAQMPME